MKLKDKIETALGSKLIASTPLGVGFGLQGLRGTLADGREIAVKALSENSPAKGADQLEIEGFMLRELATQTNLPVPEVYYSDASILVMSWIPNDGGAINPNVERHAAELLAELHDQKFTSFGYDRDTYIGPLNQPNPRTNTWLTFFRDHRLLYMARMAHEQGALSARYLARLENFAERLPDYLTEPDHPSLIHGDLWTGNVLVNSGGGGMAVASAVAVALAPKLLDLLIRQYIAPTRKSSLHSPPCLAPLAPHFSMLIRHYTRLSRDFMTPASRYIIFIRLSFMSDYLDRAISPPSTRYSNVMGFETSCNCKLVATGCKLDANWLF